MINSCINHPASNKKSNKYFIKIYDWQLSFAAQKVQGDEISKQTKGREFRCAALLSVFEYQHNFLLQDYNRDRVKKLGYCFFMSTRDVATYTLGIVNKNRVIKDTEYLQKLGAISIFIDEENGKTGYVFHPEIIQKFINDSIESNEKNSSNNDELKPKSVPCGTGVSHVVQPLYQVVQKTPKSVPCGTDNITDKNYKNTNASIRNSLQSTFVDCSFNQICNEDASYPSSWKAGHLKEPVSKTIELAFLKTDYAAYMAGNIVHMRASCKRIAKWCEAVSENSSGAAVDIAAALFKTFKQLHEENDFWSSHPFNPTTLSNQSCLGQCYQKMKLDFVKKSKYDMLYEKYSKMWEDEYAELKTEEDREWFRNERDSYIRNFIGARGN